MSHKLIDLFHVASQTLGCINATTHRTSVTLTECRMATVFQNKFQALMASYVMNHTDYEWTPLIMAKLLELPLVELPLELLELPDFPDFIEG